MSTRKRPHPARRARTITGAGSVAAVLAMSGSLAVHGAATTTVTTGPAASASSGVALATTTTTVAAATPAAASAVASTHSSGS